jgi:transposase
LASDRPGDRRHCDLERLAGLAFLETRVTNGPIEAINGLLQLAKRMARGFRSFRLFQIMAYLKAAKLKPKLPAALPT